MAGTSGFRINPRFCVHDLSGVPSSTLDYRNTGCNIKSPFADRSTCAVMPDASTHLVWRCCSPVKRPESWRSSILRYLLSVQSVCVLRQSGTGNATQSTGTWTSDGRPIATWTMSAESLVVSGTDPVDRWFCKGWWMLLRLVVNKWGCMVNRNTKIGGVESATLQVRNCNARYVVTQRWQSQRTECM